ncbi:MAG: hypothetical protein E6J90_40660 [Deltaproteobacteria bacterium]|nr:MAG: hypothetical protein E6J90_40660 [Deltaproteobacteria bacterium]
MTRMSNTAGPAAKRAWLVAAALACGCSTSALIRSDDAAYRRSIERLKRTRQLVAGSLAPEDDPAMFLQAEGLFRYRFAPPGRGFGSYLAQTAAAAIDLPVLDSLAGALDLYSLRLKTYDGAIQVWETLLVRNRSTPLRPLALYRLGWAYRNSLADGLPGGSEQAFDELRAGFAGSPLAPLALEARRAPWKSMGRATAFSLLPGLGQVYAGEVRNGLIRMAIAAVGGGMVIVPSVVAYERRGDLSWSRDWPLLVTAIAGAIIVTTDYSSSYQDALRAVLEYNERSEAEFEDRHPDAP